MRRAMRSVLLLTLLAVTAACAQHARTTQGASSATRPRMDLITRADVEHSSFTNAYDLVAALRPRWLQTRGPDSITGTPSEVQVHMDGVRLGGVGTLRNIPTGEIAYIQFFDANEATARWGLDHGQGAIYVSTRTR